MKKTIIIALAALMMVAVSCKKNIVEKTNEGNNNPTVTIEQSPDVTRIINFNKEVTARRENPDLRTREVITLDEAKDDIADLFNAVYTEPTEYYGETEHAEFIVTLPVDGNGNVLLDDAVAAYEQAVSMARENYHASALGNKGYICMSATVEQQRGGTAEVRLNGVFGTKTEAPTVTEGNPFDESLNWLYKNHAIPACEEYEDEGADYALERVMKNILFPNNTDTLEGYRTIMHSVIRKEFSGVYYKRQLFYKSDACVNETCIQGDYMNMYLDNGINIITTLLPDSLGFHCDRNLTKVYKVVSLIVEASEDVLPPNYIIPYITHKYTVGYGLQDYMLVNGEVLPADL